ncbi:class I SAM-dependent methyltransferase [Rhodocytophaga rosea]|uniref:Class I SAM-dependent methyltransferase n=1 Tax=Rhodocytophaga rosea TaxID=2704465 RepID=A0A6C0GPW8_9BACT|nr:class I SAM-dependent methyltransferase [Rhodocytophaga rosea]QHT69632.1 class I SAM-dependent methyltransferase [Rhodocytophaga rosea]
MEAAFDSVAHQYDETFTFTSVGGSQRQRVWELLAQNKLLDKPLHILEVNCGTGEDAIRFAQSGHQILATDISGEMIEVCRQKTQKRYFSNLEFKQAGFQEIHTLQAQGKFDLIFSNFGGLNCVSPLELSQFMKQAYILLKPGGNLVAVIMPPFCMWETGYYLLKGSWKKAFRRFLEKTEAVIDTHSFPVYYYNPYKLYQTIADDFEWIELAPVGLFLPPSYLENFFCTRPGWLRFLNKMEKITAPLSALGCVSDHFYLQLRKRL